MSPQDQKDRLQQVASTLTAAAQSIFLQSGKLTLTQDPESVEKDIIEYDSRLRVGGMEKFNDACYLSIVSFYFSQQQLEGHDPCGVLMLFIEESAAEKILKGLGFPVAGENEDEILKDSTGKFCLQVAQALQGQLANLGYRNLVLSPVQNFKNDAGDGVEFPYQEYKFYEVSFFLWKKKQVVFNILFSTPT